MTATESLRPVFRWVMAAWIVVAVLASAVAYYRLGPETAARTSPGSLESVTRPDGPGTSEPGVLLVVTPQSSGVLDVAELVRLNETTESISVRPPDLPSGGTTFTGRKKPFASDVRVIVPDQVVTVPDGLVNRDQNLPLEKPTRRFELRYELNRSVVPSRPSSTGRALGAIRSMTSELPDDLDVAVVAVGPAVRNLSCPELPLAEQACATGRPPLMRLRDPVPWHSAVVLLQLDLPS